MLGSRGIHCHASSGQTEAVIMNVEAGRIQTSLLEVRCTGDLASLRADWDGLLLRAKGYSFTQTCDYAFLAVEIALRKGSRAFVIQATKDGQLVGGWCLTAARQGLLLTARPASCGSQEEYGAPLVDAEYAEAAVVAIVEQCQALPVGRVVVSGVVEGSRLANRLDGRGRRLGQTEGFAVSLSRFPDWDAYAGQASRSHVYNLRRAKRRLEVQGDLVIDWCRTAADVEAVLRWAWRNKKAWAKARRIDTPYLRDDSVPEFFIDLAHRVDLETNPLVSFVRLNGELLAAQINLVGDAVIELLFTTFSQSQARCSPGDLLIQHSCQWALKHGLDCDFRMLRADYKERMSDTVTTYASYEIALTPQARVIAPLQYMAGRVTRRVRRAPGKAWQIAGKLPAHLSRVLGASKTGGPKGG